jgi:ABC-type transport system involved in cytochrome bd biosynthesis fused ATPase/permease subunit
MNDNHYPNIFRISDRKSKSSQNLFIRLNQLILVILIISAATSIVTPALNWITVLTSILISISTILTILILIVKPEKTWYEGRAIAESTKSLTWKFMMGTKPFNFEQNNEEAELNLINNLKKIVGQRKDFFVLVGSDFSNDDQITDVMTNSRNLPFQDKIKIYAKDRIEEQRNWYAKEAKKNMKFKNVSFTFLILFQILAVVSLVLELYSTINISLSPLLACFSTSAIAWLQLKRFQELSESYSITSTELNFIKSKLRHIQNEQDLENFVDDSESAISREHTLWLARRDNVELFE